ncbi:MAG: FAD-binding protein [Phycisphaerales bacterium]|nr:FAD-binding protein [Phycisphaerales bacterium]
MAHWIMLLRRICYNKGMSITDELIHLLGSDRVLTDPAELFAYDRDGFTLAKSCPRAVVFPQTTAEVSQVLALLAAHDAPIVPRGSGTGLAGGCAAYGNGIVISTANMRRIVNIDLPNRVAQVEAGVCNTRLSEEVAALPGGEKWHYSPDPSSQRASTLGGNAATNAGGIHVLKDFVTSNHVLGVEMVLPDGSILTCGATDGGYETAGFDLPALICGSEGTLGIITQLWLRLSPKPASFRTIVAYFTDTAHACQSVSAIIAAGHLPAAMEMLDGTMLHVIEDAFSFGIAPSAQAMLLIEIDGIEDLLDKQMQQITDLCRANHAFNLETSSDSARRNQLWKMRKSTFGAIGRVSHSYCTQDACVPRSMLADVLKNIDSIGRNYGLTITNVFHAGDGNVHPIFLYDERNETEVQNALRAAHEVLRFCIDAGGTLTGEHGVGVEKIDLIPYLFDAPTLACFDRIKKVFDPAEQANPGKFIPSDKLKVSLLKPGRQVPQ